MEKQRQMKLLSIVTLVVAIIGMTLGFAAFSTTLSISSSAAVTPNSEDFKISLYGMNDEFVNEIKYIDDVFKIEYYTEYNKITPVFPSYVVATKPKVFGTHEVSLNGNNIIIDNLSLVMEKPTDKIWYPVVLKNEGKYDAYVNVLFGENYSCTSEEEMSDSMLESCNYFNFATYARDMGINKVVLSDYLLKTGEYIYIMLNLGYDGSAGVWPDGPVEYEYPTISIEFSTAK